MSETAVAADIQARQALAKRLWFVTSAAVDSSASRDVLLGFAASMATEMARFGPLLIAEALLGGAAELVAGHAVTSDSWNLAKAGLGGTPEGVDDAVVAEFTGAVYAEAAGHFAQVDDVVGTLAEELAGLPRPFDVYLAAAIEVWMTACRAAVAGTQSVDQ